MGNNNIVAEISYSDIKVPNHFLHKELNPSIWNGFDIKPIIKERLNLIVRYFYDFIDLKFEVDDVRFVGSNANFNWTVNSDIDIHLIVDFSKIDHDYDFIKNFFDSKKQLWNDNHSIKIHGFDLEMYVQDTNEDFYSSGSFSLLNNKWITKPELTNFSIDKLALKSKILYYIRRIEWLENNSKAINKESIHAIASDLKDKIKKMRKAGLKHNGEFSIENLCFKHLRNKNYIKKLLNIIQQSFDDNISIHQ